MARPGRPYKVPEELESLFIYIINDDLKKVKSILKKYGVDAYDPDKRTALINAAAYGKTKITIWLIENGADINFQDKAGWTALHFAAQEKNLETLKVLIENGADPNLKNEHGNTPLWTAIFNAKEEFEIVKELIQCGADMKSKNKYGKSPEDFGLTVYGEKFHDLIR